jgi:hypothetical protein
VTLPCWNLEQVSLCHPLDRQLQPTMGVFEPGERGLPRRFVAGRLNPCRRIGPPVLKHLDLPLFGGDQVLHNLPNRVLFKCLRISAYIVRRERRNLVLLEVLEGEVSEVVL